MLSSTLITSSCRCKCSQFILCRTQEETNEKIKEFQEYLDKFAQEPSSEELEFPSTLNSHDRMLVHEVTADFFSHF